jgi:TM2 domain-containing membrane protein YozV
LYKKQRTRRADRPNPALSLIFVASATSTSRRPQGNAAENDEKWCLAAGFERYLAFPFCNSKPLPASMPTHKNKTLATALAFLLGGLGIHRFYLKGSVDRLGLLHVCSLPVAGLVYGVGQAPNPFWSLLPIFISCIAGWIEALVIGLTPDEKWDAKVNSASGRQSDSHWILAVLLVLTMLVGATAVIATLSRLFDLLYTGGAYG